MNDTPTLIMMAAPVWMSGIAGVIALARRLTEKRRFIARCNAPFPT